MTFVSKNCKISYICKGLSRQMKDIKYNLNLSEVRPRTGDNHRTGETVRCDGESLEKKLSRRYKLFLGALFAFFSKMQYKGICKGLSRQMKDIKYNLNFSREELKLYY